MKRTGIFLFITLLAFAHCLEIITVTVGPDGNEFYPSQISALSNTTLRFILPSSFLSVVQSTFNQPCTPLPGGFNSGVYGGNLGPNIWDWTIQNNTQAIWFFYQNALQPTPCNEGIVGAINSPSTSQYMEFRQIANNANLYQSNSALLPWPSTGTDDAILTTSMSDPPITSSLLPPTSGVVPMTSTSEPTALSFSPPPQSLSTSSPITTTSPSNAATSSSQLPQLSSTSGAISMASTNDPAMSSFSSLSQLSPSASLVPISLTSNPTTSSFSPLPQLLPTSSTPLPTRPPAHQNVGAIVAGTVVGAFAGIIALVVLANVAVILYRRWRDNEVYENIPAPRAPPPAMPEKEPQEGAQPGPVEMTQVSGEESRMYRPNQSNGMPFESIPEMRSAAMRLSSSQSATVPAPVMRMSMPAPRSRPHSEVETPAQCQLLLSSDPFANVARPLSSDADDRQQRQPQQQQQQQQHQQLSRQRTPSSRRSRHRQSRADSNIAPVIPENQPSIPEQDIEFIAQEVSSLIMTDPTPADRPRSHMTYSSPSIGQRSPTLGFARKSPTINYRKSPALSFRRPSAALKRSLSRGSSMEGG